MRPSCFRAGGHEGTKARSWGALGTGLAAGYRGLPVLSPRRMFTWALAQVSARFRDPLAGASQAESPTAGVGFGAAPPASVCVLTGQHIHPERGESGPSGRVKTKGRARGGRSTGLMGPAPSQGWEVKPPLQKEKGIKGNSRKTCASKSVAQDCRKGEHDAAGQFCRLPGRDRTLSPNTQGSSKPRYEDTVTAFHGFLRFRASQPLHKLFPPAGMPFSFS